MNNPTNIEYMTEEEMSEFLKCLNEDALYRSLENMEEVPSMNDALQASKYIERIAKSNYRNPDPKAKCKPTYCIMQIKYKNNNILAATIEIDGAQILLRATNLDTRKYYIPREIWVAITDANNEPRVERMFGLA